MLRSVASTAWSFASNAIEGLRREDDDEDDNSDDNDGANAVAESSSDAATSTTPYFPGCENHVLDDTKFLASQGLQAMDQAPKRDEMQHGLPINDVRVQYEQIKELDNIFTVMAAIDEKPTRRMVRLPDINFYQFMELDRRLRPLEGMAWLRPLPAPRSVNPFRAHLVVMEERRAHLEAWLRGALVLAHQSQSDAPGAALLAFLRESEAETEAAIGDVAIAVEAEIMSREDDPEQGKPQKKRPSLWRTVSKLDEPTWSRSGSFEEEAPVSPSDSTGGVCCCRSTGEKGQEEPARPPPGGDGGGGGGGGGGGVCKGLGHEQHQKWLTSQVEDDFRDRYATLPPLLARSLYCWAQSVRLKCLPSCIIDLEMGALNECTICCVGIFNVLPKIPVAAVIALFFFAIPQLTLLFVSSSGGKCNFSIMVIFASIVLLFGQCDAHYFVFMT